MLNDLQINQQQQKIATQMSDTSFACVWIKRKAAKFFLKSNKLCDTNV